jgi:hypothetical protein
MDTAKLAEDMKNSMEKRGRTRGYVDGIPWEAFLTDELQPLCSLLFADNVGSPEWESLRNNYVMLATGRGPSLDPDPGVRNG